MHSYNEKANGQTLKMINEQLITHGVFCIPNHYNE